jgi:hypothetical protein
MKILASYLIRPAEAACDYGLLFYVKKRLPLVKFAIETAVNTFIQMMNVLIFRV